MNGSELSRALIEARSSEECVTVLAGYFRHHDLVFGHGTDNAEDEAYWLIRHHQGWRDEAWSRAPEAAVLAAVVDCAKRRVRERRPLAYLLGEAWFAGLRFEVNERVLIPRSPLAELIERRFEPWCVLQPGDRVLDIGTGSGCIAIACAHYCPETIVDATDISAAALEVARNNVARHRVKSRVTLWEADLFPTRAERYRVIIANPPYVPTRQWAALPPEYAHEPAGALVAGAGGLEIVERILRGARDRLTHDGVLIVEVGEGMDAMMQAHPRLPMIWLEFERGGDGVFLLTAEQLGAYEMDGSR